MNEPNGITRGTLAAARFAEEDARRRAHLDALIAAGKGDKRQTQPAPARAIQTPIPVSHKAPTKKTAPRARQATSRRLPRWRHPGTRLDLLSSHALRLLMTRCALELRRRARE